MGAVQNNKKAQSKNSACLERIIDKYIHELSLPVDNPYHNEFEKFRQERIDTGIDKSCDLFSKEVDKWPLM